MAERKTLLITQVNEIQKVGDKQWPKLSFKAKDGDRELTYSIWKQGLFGAIKQGETITADVETTEQGEYTNRKIVQIYADGQPVSGKGTGQRWGKSPEELEQQARLMILAYSKDLVVADKVSLEDMLREADRFYTWLKVTDKVVVPTMTQTERKEAITSGTAKISGEEQEFENLDKPKSPTGKKVQNITELKSLMMRHKIPTHEAKEILSIKEFDELKDLDKAWADIKKAKGIEP